MITDPWGWRERFLAAGITSVLGLFSWLILVGL
jgi:hypothetical protein